ncbi:MAG TPA: glucose-6-phosphate dehydrogenase [Candidatus Saccharimonadales bacterium]|nr:glucose-6-phosphate dehydrogenase [Candidatus Saccharimonadales bacterium]
MAKHITIPPIEPSTLVIFGITGDLARRKLLPALYHLCKQSLLPEQFRIVGVSRRGITVPALLKTLHDSLAASGGRVDKSALEALGRHIELVQMDLLAPDEYVRLRKRLDDIETEMGMCMNRLFYLAVPSQTFEPVVAQLGKGGLNKACPHGTGGARLLIEKPFGYNLASAKELITALGKHFSEEQIYRIDHYLAKETAQNILNFRFQNPIFRRVWDNSSIKSITITASESIDIEGRVAFYEQTGALRDFVQSHLLQLLALVTMDEPSALTSAAIHRQKLALLQDILPIAPNKVMGQTVRGQYKSYRREVDNQKSNVETYAAVRLRIDSQRWRNVPVVLKTGKALREKLATIVLVFTDSGHLTGDNVLTIRIQPDEGISLQLLAKKPGFTDEVEPVTMDFSYTSAFAGDDQPDAYERVLMDAFRGDKTLFATSDEVLTSWRILENVIHEWEKNDEGLELYAKGSDGPNAIERLMKMNGKQQD